MVTFLGHHAINPGFSGIIWNELDYKNLDFTEV